ncbi:helix-turn-helix domain-containing protein [Pedobacter polaris]|nr:helix-turn-helix domain-containing protein [Pedobacter polaris]
MELGEKIAQARKNKGLTQEQLAELTKVTGRTIQRIESGASEPRTFTLKVIAEALDTSFEQLNSTSATGDIRVNIKPDTDEQRHFLQLLTLSCFSYILIPVFHFLIPLLIFKRSKDRDASTIKIARRIIRTQIYWVVATNIFFLLCLGYNLISAVYFKREFLISYLVPFFVTYLFNAGLLFWQMLEISKADLDEKRPN